MQLEEIFGVIGCVDDQCISLATFMMKGEAKHWWNTIRDTLVGEYDEPPTWEAFLEVFRDYYFPPSVHEKKELEFLELEQGNMIVLQYKAKFMEVVCCAPHIVASDAMKARKFQWALRTNIRSQMSVLQLNNFMDVVETACIAQRETEEIYRTSDKSMKRTSIEETRVREDKTKVFKKRTLEEKETCQKCGKRHWGACYRDPGAYYKCGKVGHQMRDCPYWGGEPGQMPMNLGQRPKGHGRMFAIIE